MDGGVYADGGKYASEFLPFSINPIEYTGKKVLAVPRCCQHKKGTQDRMRINSEVAERDSRSGNVRKLDAITQDAAVQPTGRFCRSLAIQQGD